jgi:hypothetical protein
MSDMNRLALMLKLRFLHHLPREQQRSQLALMTEVAGERA